MLARWLRNVTSEEYREGSTLLKELVREKQVAYWLMDSRRLSNVTFADQQWIKREIVPAVISAGLQKFARVLTEDVFNYISFENVMQQAIEADNTPVEIAQFTSLEAALAWLNMD